MAAAKFCWSEWEGFHPPPWFERYQHWIVVGACFTTVFLALGIECSYVILFVYLQEEFNSSATATGKVFRHVVVSLNSQEHVQLNFEFGRLCFITI